MRLGHQVVCVSPLYRKPPPEYACQPLGVGKEFQVFGQRFKVRYCHTIKQGMSPQRTTPRHLRRAACRRRCVAACNTSMCRVGVCSPR